MYWEHKVFQIYISCMTKCSQLPFAYPLLSLSRTLVSLSSFPWTLHSFLLLNLSTTSVEEAHSSAPPGNPMATVKPFSQSQWSFPVLVQLAFFPKILLFSTCSLFTPLTENPFPVWPEMLRFPRLEHSSYHNSLSC